MYFKSENHELSHLKAIFMYGFQNDQMIDIKIVKDFTLVKQYINKIFNFFHHVKC
jgi:hypothetical protein